MKVLLKYSWLCLILGFSRLLAQQTGTVTITSPNQHFINTGDFTGRDQVQIVPGGQSSEIHLLPQQATDKVHLYTDPSIIIPVAYQPSNGLGGTITRTLDLTLPVGSTMGTYDVNAFGGLSYFIPIDLPSGTNGLLPKLGINYNSFGTNGILGFGWNLAGMSSITRKPKDLYHDNYIAPIDFASTEPLSLALDGNYLIPRSFQNNVPTYGTEREEFSVISPIGTTGNGPTWFKVETRDGLTFEYGNSSDSKLIPDGQTGILTWHVNKIYDNYGNYILFHYQNQNGELWIEKISYTGNTAANISPYNAVKFYYEERQDKNFAFVSGGKINASTVLRRIEISSENELVKSFDFKYTFNNYITFLQEIIELGSQGHSYNSMLFKYQSDEATDPKIERGDMVAIDLNTTHDFVKHTYLDFDGDGKTDVVRFVGKQPEGGILINTEKEGIGWFFHEEEQFTWSEWDVSKNVGTNITDETEFDQVSLNATPLPDGGTGYMWMEAMEIDGDGKEDLLIFKPSNSVSANVYACLGSNGLAIPTSTPYYARIDINASSKTKNLIFLDINGDGKTELINPSWGGPGHPAEVYIVNLTTGTPAQYDYAEGFDFSKAAVLDIDGDGKQEVVNVKNGNNKYIFGMFQGFVLPYAFIPDNSGYDYNPYNYFPSYESYAAYPQPTTPIDFYGDYNGDSKSDILNFNNAGGASVWTLYIGKGDGTYYITTPTTSLPDPLDNSCRLLASDFNADGKTDLISIPINGSNNNTLIAYYSLGEDFISESHILDLTITHPEEIFLGDFNGDGNRDFIVSSYTNPNLDPSIIYFYKGIKSKRIHEIVDGFNNKTEFQFEPLTSSASGYYSQVSTQSYPFANPKIPIYPISKITSDNGIGGTITVDYTYEDAITHRTGLGFLGFNKIAAFNNSSRVRSVRNYNVLSTSYDATIIEHPLVSQETFTVDVSGNSTLITKTDYTSDIFAFDLRDIRHFMRVTNKTESDFTGATSITSYAYDNIVTPPNNGNFPQSDLITKITTNVNNGLEIREQTNTYTSYTDFQAFPSRLQATTTKVIRQNQPLYERHVSYAYTDEGDIKTVTRDPGTAKEVNVDYTYFSTGAVDHITTSAIDGLSETKTVSYAYDANHRFPVSFFNELNQETKYTYEKKYGVPKTVTGIDNLVTTFTYDEFGRNIFSVTPDGLTSTTLYEWVQPSETGSWGSDPVDVSSNALFKIVNATQGSPGTTSYHDIFGRSVKTMMDGHNAPGNVVQSYDAKGNLFQASSSYESTGASVNRPIVTTYTYDDLNRLKSALVSNHNASKQINFGISYQESSGNSTITAVTNGKTFTKVYDPTGLLINSSDNAASVTYVYGSHHKPVEIALGGVPITTVVYDAFGMPATESEKNTGNTMFTYNAYGQLHTKTDNAGRTFTYTYDKLDRLKQESGAGETYDYLYVSSGNGINQLEKVTGPNGFDCSYTYDALNRLTQKQENAGGIFITKLAYDQFNNLSKITYPGSAFSITKTYDAHGYLKTIKRGDNGDPIWTTNVINAMGQFSDYTLGNSISVQKTFTDFGHPINFSSNGNNGPIQNYDFAFDHLTGNLASRTDNLHNQTEAFTYDLLDRLLTVNGNSTLNMAYAPNGNISSKSDVGTYTYHNLKVNAVTEVTNSNNIISHNTQAIDYTSFNKARVLKETDAVTGQLVNKLDYIYNPMRQRCKGDLFDGNGTNLGTTFYQDGYEKIVSGNITTEINYIDGGDGLCAMYVKENNVGNLYFVFRDHLGSILKVTDANGTSVAEQSFDAWGRPRDPANWSSNTLPNNPSWLIRGYTGHEQLPHFGLINMNGRMYDPVNARMASADVLVQESENSQSYNRYSYCLNNPLKYVDPSGYQWSYDYDDIGDGWPPEGGYNGFMPFMNGDLFMHPMEYTMDLPTIEITDYYNLYEQVNGGDQYVLGDMADYITSAGYGNDEEDAVVEDETFGEGFVDAINPSNIWEGIKNTFTTTAGIADFITNAATLGFYGVYSDAVNVTKNIYTGNAYELGRITGNTAVQVAGATLAVRGMNVARTSSRAFFSGAGTETRAISKGYQTLGQTRAARNLQNLINSKNIPWTQAEPMWQRLSATWAKGVPNGSIVNVFLNNPRLDAIWFKTELPILQQKGVTIIYR